MKKLLLKGGEFAFVDDEDYERCLAYSWYIHHKSKNVFYVAGILKKKRSPTISCYLHHFIMKAEKGQRVDHKNGNNLDNTKENLRFCTQQQNNCNRKPGANRHGFKGIGQSTKTKLYRAHCTALGITYKSEWFESSLEAAKEYDRMAIKYQGEFARTNFPRENYI
jgi:hypothetical protein